jgi:hypothetical protein
MVDFLFLFILKITIFSFLLSIETFMQTDPSGRVPYSSLPAIIQRFGMTLTENNIISAVKDLGYNGKRFFFL